MRYKNELLVGAAIVGAVLIVIFGIRFLTGSPLFGGGYPLVAVFDDAQGLTAGSTVRVNGVRVGRVERVRLSPDAQRVVVDLEIDPGVAIPRGATLGTGGLSALGDVNVAITPGPSRNPPLAAGDTLYAAPGGDLFGLLQDNAERLFGQADTLVTGAAGTFSRVDRILADSEGDLRATLAGLRGTTTAVDQLLRAERGRLQTTLANLQAASAGAARLTDDLGRFSDANADTLAATVAQLRRTLAQTEASLTGLSGTQAQLDETLARLNAGEGTLGLLLTDPDLYYNLNATLDNLNRVLLDFQNDPARYLRELRLLRVF